MLAHRVAAQRVLLLARASALAGFALLWTAGTPVQAGAGLALAGFGTGNLYPLGLALAVGAAPRRSWRRAGSPSRAQPEAIRRLGTNARYVPKRTASPAKRA